MKRYRLLLIGFVVLLSSGFASAQCRSGVGTGMGMMGWGMMGGAWDYIPPGDVKPLTIDQAGEAVHEFLEAFGNPDLKLSEVMEFSNHFYAEVEEESTGIHAFEILINRYTGDIFPEPGPNMMWNTRYGHMGGGMMGWGMMGGRWRSRGRGYEPQGEGGSMKVMPGRAVALARRYLDSWLPGVKADSEVDTFYGYYTVHTLKNGKIYGMLGVNGYTGQVWYHTWHGDFLGMKEFGGHD